MNSNYIFALLGLIAAVGFAIAEIKNQRANSKPISSPTNGLPLNREARAQYFEEQACMARAQGLSEAADSAEELAYMARSGLYS